MCIYGDGSFDPTDFFAYKVVFNTSATLKRS